MTRHSRNEALALDRADPLKDTCQFFDLPDGVIYLDGNSLGPPPLMALKRLEATAKQEWQQDLITSWNKAGWFDLPKHAGAKIARLIGVRDDDVLVTDTVSANIFKLAAALYRDRPGIIAYEAGEFPTDGYILQGLAQLTGAPLKTITPADINALSTDNISVLVKSAVHYKSAKITDIAAWEDAASRAGTRIIWDLSHATGLIDLSLAKAGANYAVGCGYKYLNGGPGAPAFVYAEGAIANRLHQPLAGWMGHAAPFTFDGTYKPANGIARFASGTPPILSLSTFDGALDVFDGIDMAQVEQKALALGDLFLGQLKEFGFALASPDIGQSRGGHVSLEFDYGYNVVQALIDRGVIGDFRAPNIMRFGFSPLYLSYKDVFEATEIFRDIMLTERWRAPQYAAKSKVT